MVKAIVFRPVREHFCRVFAFPIVDIVRKTDLPPYSDWTRSPPLARDRGPEARRAGPDSPMGGPFGGGVLLRDVVRGCAIK